MYRVLNFPVLIRYVAILTTILTVLFVEVFVGYFGVVAPWARVTTIAPWIALALVFIITGKASSRLLWLVARFVNPSLYPDLNGRWDGEITTEKGDVIEARAYIRQGLLQMEIDMHTATAKSVTLETTPALEGGRLKLYYKYRAKPKEPSHGSYTGSTIFDVEMISKKGDVTLSGYYYTDRKTLGRSRFTKSIVNPDHEQGVAFY